MPTTRKPRTTQQPVTQTPVVDHEYIAKLVLEHVDKSKPKTDNIIDTSTFKVTSRDAVMFVFSALVITAMVAMWFATNENNTSSTQNQIKDHAARLIVLEKYGSDIQQMKSDMNSLKSTIENNTRSLEAYKSTMDYVVADIRSRESKTVTVKK